MYFNNGEYLPDSLSWSNINYALKNIENSRFFPSSVHLDCALTAYNYRYLFQRALSVFEWKIPESVPLNYFLYVMYNIGYGFVFNTKTYGTIFNHGGISGYDVYYQPRKAVIANPLLTEEYNENPEYYSDMTIDKDCAIIRLTPDYMGIRDVCTYYAELLSTASSSLVTNLFNTKLAYVFGAENKNIAESIKKLYDLVASGEPAVFADKRLFDDNGNLRVNVFDSNVKNVYIGEQLIIDIRSIMNDFDSVIGIPNSNQNKKERMIVDEANMNNFETQALCHIWLNTLKRDIEKSNKMFPEFTINVDFRKEVKQNNAESRNDNTVNAI